MVSRPLRPPARPTPRTSSTCVIPPTRWFIHSPSAYCAPGTVLSTGERGADRQTRPPFWTHSPGPWLGRMRTRSEHAPDRTLSGKRAGAAISGGRSGGPCDTCTAGDRGGTRPGKAWGQRDSSAVLALVTGGARTAAASEQLRTRGLWLQWRASRKG